MAEKTIACSWLVLNLILCGGKKTCTNNYLYNVSYLYSENSNDHCFNYLGVESHLMNRKKITVYNFDVSCVYYNLLLLIKTAQDQSSWVCLVGGQSVQDCWLSYVFSRKFYVGNDWKWASYCVETMAGSTHGRTT